MALDASSTGQASPKAAQLATTAAGKAPRRMGYEPFHVSFGAVDAFGAKAGCPSLGRLHHSCWTYWGHSGAPLFDQHGCVVGLHNSWDEDNDGQRHAVDWERIVRFLR